MFTRRRSSTKASNAARLYGSLPSPMGRLWVARSSRGLCAVSFPMSRKRFLARFPSPVQRDERAFSLLRQDLADYFAGRRVRWRDRLDLSKGTPFQQQVWQALRRIPYGSVRSYAWVARAIGRPKAARAVGQAVGRNPLGVLIPCHRVIRGDGSMGGFGAGPQIKRFLLRLEGVVTADGSYFSP